MRACVNVSERPMKPTGLFSAFTWKEKVPSYFYFFLSILLSVHGTICFTEHTVVRISLCARVCFLDRKSTNVLF